MELENKNIIITGASSGIGAAAARLFAQEGANVMLGGSRNSQLRLSKVATVPVRTIFLVSMPSVSHS